MLILTRKLREKIFIGDDIVIVVTGINGDRVRIGIEAPRNVEIARAELLRLDDPRRDNEPKH